VFYFLWSFCFVFVQLVILDVIIGRAPGFDTWTKDGMNSPSKGRWMFRFDDVFICVCRSDSFSFLFLTQVHPVCPILFCLSHDALRMI